MAEELIIFTIVEKLAPIATVASLSIVAATMCRRLKLNMAFDNFMYAFMLFLICVISSFLYLMGWFVDITNIVIPASFFGGILLLAVAAYNLYRNQ